MTVVKEPRPASRKRKKRRIYPKKKQRIQAVVPLRPPQLKKKKQRQRKRRRQFMRRLRNELLLTVGLFLLLFFFVQRLTFTLPVLEGYSMTPTLSDGERFFVNKLGTIRRFKLVYYRDPKSQETSIRRVIGVPGDELTYQDDQLKINNHDMVERFLEREKAHAKDNQTVLTEDFSLFSIIGTTRLPKDEYFVLGDNRPYASDSRTFGTVKKKDIIGVVEMRLLPFHQLTRF